MILLMASPRLFLGEAPLGIATGLRSPADMCVRDRGELTNQRCGEEDEPECDFVEAAQLAAAGGEQEYNHCRDGQDEGDGVHVGS
jgi:hypothetical protein